MCRSITRCRPPFKPATCVAAAAAYMLFNYFAIHVQSQTIKAILIRTILLCAPNCNLANVPPSPIQFSCTSGFICMLWQAHVVWQIQQLVHKLRIRIYPFLLHIPRRTWSIIRRRFLKTVTQPALELSKRITLKRPPSPLPALVGQLWWLGCCVQLMWQPSSAGSILIALKNNKQNTCWLVAATTGH